MGYHDGDYGADPVPQRPKKVKKSLSMIPSFIYFLQKIYTPWSMVGSVRRHQF
jgi:hypothetical protein